jgi:hypothetical protein
VHSSCNHKFSQAAVDKLKAWVEKGGYLFTEDWGMTDVIERAWGSYAKSGTYLSEQNVDVAPTRGETTNPMLRGVFVGGKKIITHKVVKEGENGPDLSTEVEVSKETIEERLSQPKNEWKVDDESPNIVVNNKQAVTVLMESKKINDERGGQGAVAITFGGPKYIPGTETTTEKKGKITEDGLKTGVPPPQDGVPISSDKSGRAKMVPGPMGRVMHVLSHFGRQANKEDEFALQNLLINFLLEGRDMMKYRKK